MKTMVSNMTHVCLGDVAREIKQKAPVGQELPTVGLEHLDPGEVELAHWDEGVETTFTKAFSKGQVLFGRRRAYLRKAAVAPFDGICSGDITVIATKDGLSPRLLPFIVQNESLFDHAVTNSAGSLSPRVKWQSLSQFEFELPNADKQEELADILWAAQETRSRYKQLLTVCGDVVKSQFVDAVQSAHNPSFVRLDDLVREGRPITYGIVKPGGNVEDGIPIIKVKDYPNGTIDESDLLYASPAIEEKYARSRLKQGDLLFSIRGSVGRMAFVPESLVGANLTQDTARLSLREELDPEYIRGVLRLPEVDHWIRHHIKGVAVQGVNLRDLRNLEIPILSEEKQAELGRFVASVDKSKFAVQKALDELNATTKKILNQELGLGDV